MLWILYYFGLIDLNVLRQSFDSPFYIILATFLLLLTIPLAGYRWHLLLRSLEFTSSMLWAIKTTWVGCFCNLFFPGSCGGDIARGALAYRLTGAHLSKLSFSILVDRLTGLLSLVILAICLIPWLPVQLHWWGYTILAVVLGVTVSACALGALFGKKLADYLEFKFGRVGERVSHVIKEVILATDAYVSHWPIVVYSVILSIVQFIMILISLFFVAIAMGFNDLTALNCFIAGLWSLFVNAIPISPGGLGVGEAAFNHLVILLQENSSSLGYATIFLGYRVLAAVSSSIGVFLYVPVRDEIKNNL